MNLHLNRRTAGATAVLGAATLAVALLPGGAGTAAAATLQTITIDGIDTPTVGGVDHVSAGWVQVRITNFDDFSFFSTHAGVDPKSARSSQFSRPRRAAMAAAKSGGRVKPSAISASQAAKDIKTFENTSYGFGGGTDLGQSKAETFTIKLPVGTIAISDDTSEKIIAEFTVTAGASTAAPHADNRVTEGKDHLLHSPTTLPRKGTIEFSNTTSSAAWHEIGLIKVPSGTTRTDVVNAFNGKSKKVPLQFGSAVQAGPLSPKHSEFIAYSLPKGTYVLLDTWLDDKTGKVYVEEGSIKLIKVK